MILRSVIAAAALAVAAAVAGCSAAPSVTASPSAVQTIAQPETAAQVAAQIGATRFVNEGPGPLVGVQTSGTAYYHGRKIGIDTFADTASRDQWLTMASGYGVSPLLEGPNWVAYWSVSGS